VSKQVVSVPNAPKYPFSPAIRAGDYIFVSGQGGFQDPDTGETIKGIEAQTRQFPGEYEADLRNGRRIFS